MLDLEFFTRDTNIKATVICDSISEQGVRLTTFEIEYPRFIHSEVMTHRNLSKNSSSSRAIPITKMLEQIESNMAIPLYWGKAKSGMQATEEVDIDDVWWYEEKWKFAFDEVSYRIKQLSDNVEGKKGFMPPLHKQVPNRLSEPFQMMKVVITGTDFDNFFNLRLHPDADPNICMLAYKMYEAMQESKPIELKAGEWHLPFVNIGWNGKGEMCYADEDFNFISLDKSRIPTYIPHVNIPYIHGLHNLESSLPSLSYLVFYVRLSQLIVFCLGAQSRTRTDTLFSERF